MGYVVANAIPANPTPAKVLQPDGSYLTVCLFGDEFMHYTTTQDGYTVVKSPSGYYMYAELADGQLVASSHIARDEVARTSSDLTYLHTVQKNLKPELTATGSAMRGVMKSMAANPLLSPARTPSLTSASFADSSSLSSSTTVPSPAPTSMTTSTTWSTRKTMTAI